MKDIFFGVILILCLGEVFRRRVVHFYNDFYILFIGLVLGSLAVSFFFVPLLGVLAGLRMMMSLLLLPFLFGIVDDRFITTIAKTMLILFFAQLTLQLFQVTVLRNMMFGANFLGLSRRNPGFYIVPSSAGFFTLVVLYFTDYYLIIRSTPRRVLLAVAIFVSVFLTGSGTALITYFLYQTILLFAKFDRKSRQVILLPSIIVVIGFFAMLPIITGRPDIFLSLVIRMGIAGDVIQVKNLIVSPNFGLGTNIAMLLKVPGALILDSTYSALIYNVGLLGFFTYVLFFFKLIESNLKMPNQLRQKQFISFCLIYLVFSFTVIIFEAFPMNFLFALGLSFFSWRARP
ncbi:MAG: hypothetical protein ACTHLE_26815, partial [Agriterribacter sp.]